MDKALSTQLPNDPATVIAVVGSSQILFGDLQPKVEARITQVTAQTTQEIPEEQLKYARVNLLRGLLNQAIQNKMMRESFLLDQVGTQAAEKYQEAKGLMSSRARQMFYESEVPQLKKKHKIENLAELDKILRAEGSSLLTRERDFIDAMLGHMYLRSKVDRDPKITLAEIAQYYNRNRDDYARKARARWEQLSVLFENHPDKDAANKKLQEMGREGYYGGNMQAVARAKSEEPFASEGGLHDWTNQGSLASAQLDEKIFSLPLNEMSEIIEDDAGLHIIRVLEREPAGVTSLKDVQDKIEEKLKSEKVASAQEEMIRKMQARVPVWTIFPDDIPGAKTLRVPQVAMQPNASTFK
ncbi:MAG: peptidyl-prolyl cis-trans isomerase [Pirellulaceae bacterium]|nr:peptidyl-prolyl cis-trans isomerase [Pirellulaceae bacterium]